METATAADEHNAITGRVGSGASEADFCCCHNDNTKTKKQEARMTKIFGRFHLNNISRATLQRRLATTFRARTHTRAQRY